MNSSNLLPIKTPGWPENYAGLGSVPPFQEQVHSVIQSHQQIVDSSDFSSDSSFVNILQNNQKNISSLDSINKRKFTVFYQDQGQDVPHSSSKRQKRKNLNEDSDDESIETKDDDEDYNPNQKNDGADDCSSVDNMSNYSDQSEESCSSDDSSTSDISNVKSANGFIKKGFKVELTPVRKIKPLYFEDSNLNPFDKFPLVLNSSPAVYKMTIHSDSIDDTSEIRACLYSIFKSKSEEEKDCITLTKKSYVKGTAIIQLRFSTFSHTQNKTFYVALYEKNSLIFRTIDFCLYARRKNNHKSIWNKTRHEQLKILKKSQGSLPKLCMELEKNFSKIRNNQLVEHPEDLEKKSQDIGSLQSRTKKIDSDIPKQPQIQNVDPTPQAPSFKCLSDLSQNVKNPTPSQLLLQQDTFMEPDAPSYDELDAYLNL